MIFITDFFKKLFGKKEEKESKQPIEKPIELFADEKIQVQKDEEFPKLWKGRVFTAGESNFAVDIPELMEEFPFPFREGQDMIVSLTRDNKVARFRCRLEKIAWKRKPPIILLSYPTNVEWQESVERKHVRINVDLPARVRHDKLDEKWYDIRINDFSISGLSFLSNEPFKKDDMLVVKLLSMEFHLELKGIVTRASKVEERTSGEKPNYNIGMKFVELNDIDKQAVANYAWKLQRMGM